MSETYYKDDDLKDAYVELNGYYTISELLNIIENLKGMIETESEE